jgi:hypothetical protein
LPRMTCGSQLSSWNTAARLRRATYATSDKSRA